MVTVQSEPAGGEAWVCEVAVEQKGELTRHTVNVSAAELARWGTGGGTPAVEDLVRRSFEFLLERESPGSILRRFDLSDIRRYFPEYDELFRRESPGR
jgi:hypothetical protein